MSDRALLGGALALAALLVVAGSLPPLEATGPTRPLPDVVVACPPDCVVEVPLPPQAGGVAFTARADGARVWVRLGETAARSEPDGRVVALTDQAPDRATVVARGKRAGRLRGVAVGSARRAPGRVALLATAEVLAGFLLLGVLARLARARGALVVAGGLGAALTVGVLAPMARLEALLVRITGVEPDPRAHGYLAPDLPFLVQKLGGHGGAFAGLGALAAGSGVGLGATAARLAALAVLSEAAQCLTPDRSPSLLDAAVDLSGGLLGFLVVRRWVRGA